MSLVHAGPVQEFFGDLVEEVLLELGHPQEDYVDILAGLQQNRGAIKAKLLLFFANSMPRNSQSSEDELSGYRDHVHSHS